MTEGTILVIGATGFIGREVVGALAALGFGVVRAGRSEDDCDLSFDIGDAAAVEKCAVLGPIDTVINCAGLAHQFGETSADAFLEVNAVGAATAMEIAVQAEARRFVHLSSVAVYGDYGAELVDEEFDCRPSGDYASSKFEGERRIRELVREGGPELVIVRPSTVIGAGDRGNTARLARQIARGRFLRIGAGLNKKSLVACSDVAAAVARIVVFNGDASGTFNVSAEPVTMSAIVDSIATALDRKLPPVIIPPALFDAADAINRRTLRLGSIARICATAGKFVADDLYSARRFDEKFGKLAYRDIASTLSETAIAAVKGETSS